MFSLLFEIFFRLYELIMEALGFSTAWLHQVGDGVTSLGL
jgi:hypothetical protein